MLNSKFIFIFILLFSSTLKAQNAYLSVTANILDATVKLNNVEKGKTPYEAMIPHGTYSLIITKSISEDEEYFYSEKITVKSNDIKKINATLERRYTEAYRNKEAEKKRKLEEIKKKIVYGSIIDKNDGQTYKTVVIGAQTWFAENLNTSKFRNGDSIKEARTDEDWQNAGKSLEPAWCYYFENEGNVKKLGKLYNWYAVSDPRGLAPEGWHIPTLTEVKSLIDYLGGAENAGSKLRNVEGWNKLNTNTNESGFSGIPCHGRKRDGTFRDGSPQATFWISEKRPNPTNDPDLAEDSWMFTFVNPVTYGSDETRIEGYFRGAGFSVRCIKN